MHEGYKIGVEIKMDSYVGCVGPSDEAGLKFVQVDDPERIVGTLVAVVDGRVVECDGDRRASKDDGATDVGDGRQRC